MTSTTVAAAGDLGLLADRAVAHVERFRCAGCPPGDWAGRFGFRPGAPRPDLFGTVDAVYVLAAVGALADLTTTASRAEWAGLILDHQDPVTGWFGHDNLRGHGVEHATAYAIGALTLLEVDEDEDHLGAVRALTAVEPLLEDPNRTARWLERMGLELSLRGLRRRRLGWHHVWSGSHVAGGVITAVAMTRRCHGRWWPRVDTRAWLSRTAGWLHREVDPGTGLWQKAFWNRLVRKPTLVDLGGAAHLLWAMGAAGRPVPHPEPLVRSVLGLQRPGGGFGRVPSCLDFDAAWCLRTAAGFAGSPELEQLVAEGTDRLAVHLAEALSTLDWSAAYPDSHGLPGALAALLEARLGAGLPSGGWLRPFDRVCWL